MRKVLLGIVLAIAALPVRAEPVTIAALGDSLTQGYGLVEQDGLVPQLQRWLSGKGADAVLINAGVSGDTTAGGAARIDWTLTPDVDGLIVALGGNDLLRGIDPEVSRANLDLILKAAQSANVPVLLIGMEAPGNYGPDYKQKFEANYVELSDKYKTLFEPSFLAGLAGPGADPAALAPLMQSDGIHPNAKGVRHIVEAIGPKVLLLVERAQGG